MPAAGGYVPGEAVVLQLVALVLAEPREPAAQVREDLRRLPAAQHGLIRRGDERGQGLLHYVNLPRHEQRHAAAREGGLERAAVVLEAAHGHGDIAPAAARARELERLRGGEGALVGYLGRGVQAYAPGGVELPGGVCEEVVGEDVHGRALAGPGRLHAAGYALLAGAAHEPAGGGAREVK